MSPRTVDSVVKDFLKIEWDATLVSMTAYPPGDYVEQPVRDNMARSRNKAEALAKVAEQSAKYLEMVANGSSGDLEDLLIFASAQVAVLREQMADISDLEYYSEHVASEAGRKVLSEVTERYAPYRKKKNWGERRKSEGLILKQNPHVS
ncbi:hypothetical protein [Abiotrophia defectiva]|uniref:hypothetical protein n=1 Tax=Abiotrophia defectiva TaxID=46125 RepID=UPI0026EA9B6E|nr:hypothetical protein [Abiotrophia defectiva]